MKRYIAQIPLRPYLAIPSNRAYVFDTRLDDAERLAGLQVVGFGGQGQRVENPEVEIGRVARELVQKWQSEGKTAQLVIRSVQGTRNLDVTRLGDPIHVIFANWRSTPDGIAEFTRKYGFISKCDYAENGECQFEISRWIEDQHIFQTWWRFGLGSPP